MSRSNGGPYMEHWAISLTSWDALLASLSRSGMLDSSCPT